ncbi:aminotransferase class IV [Candidatus Mcinerneyibacteriota bacterium]|nr:aminotransferase class IV [Candidatus Mcinerneyibacteriota bacterium]
MTVIWHNGQFKDIRDKVLSPESPGLQFGTGCFTTMFCSSEGCEFLSAHLERLKKSLGLFRMDFKNEDYQSLAETLLEKNGWKEARMKILCVENEEKGTDTFLMPSPAGKEPEPVHLVLSGEKRGDLFIYKHKLTSYAYNAYYMREAARSGRDTLFIDYRSHLLETATANLFLIRGNEILTPHHSLPLLDGIIKEELLKAQSAGPYQIREEFLTAEDLTEVEGAFLTNSVKKIIPVSSLEGRSFDSVRFPALERSLRAILNERAKTSFKLSL